MEITYSLEFVPTPEEYIDILNRSTLGERRPVDEPERIAMMVNHADIIASAFDGDKLVGIARCITDYSYCTYLSDIAVDERYQKQGIGKQLIEISREKAGRDVMYFCFAAPAAAEYYKKVGFESITRGWILLPDK